jgi:hypothetical protein
MLITVRNLRSPVFWLVSGLALVACSPDDSAPQPEFHMQLTTTEVMAHVIDPAAWGLWGRAGTITDEEGETSLTPDTEEEWAAAENEAAIVAEAGNLLQLPGRIRILEEDDKGDWSRFARQLSERALEVLAATEARDADLMFEAGGRLYEACVACHEKYYVPFLEEDETTPAPTVDKTVRP